jgi:lysophospholipase L1-like esterase
VARYLFQLSSVTPAGSYVRLDSASGATSPTAVSPVDAAYVVPGAVIRSDASTGALPRVAAGVATLYQKTLNASGGVTATATLTGTLVDGPGPGALEALTFPVPVNTDPAGLAASAASAAFSGTFARRPAPSRIWGMGDSITANGYTAGSSTVGPLYSGQSVLQMACQLSGAKVRFGGIAATGGFTSAQIIATHLPTVLAARPQFCVVLCGTNDVPLGGSASKANLLTIWTTLANAGITPILATLTPRNDYTGSNVNTITTFNAWITRQAMLNGWPLVDYYAATADPATGTYTSGYNLDNVHPNAVGAKAMGQALANVLTSVAGQAALPPPLALANTWPNMTGIVPTNALNLTSTTGLASGWGVDSGSGATTTVTAMSASEGVGNWFNVTRGGASIAYRTTSFATVVPGNRMAIGFRYKTANIVSASAAYRLRLIDTGTAASLWEFSTLSSGSGGDVTLGTVYEEFDVPASYATTTVKFLAEVRNGDATVSVGQLTVLDLTATGIYP